MNIFIEKYKKAFSENTELPIAFWYSDGRAATEPKKFSDCIFKYLKNMRAGEVITFCGKKLDESTLNAYLYRAVQNKCVDAIRHKTVKYQYSSAAGKKMLQMESEYFYASRNEIEDGLLSLELKEQIDAAIETLPPKGKEIFKLYFEHQKTAKEIASIMEISRSTVENHIYTCIKALRQKLVKYLMTMLM